MRRAGGLTGSVAGVALVAEIALVAGVASAHELDATAVQSPVPLSLLYAGAGATVAVTAGWLGFGDRTTVAAADRDDTLPDRTVVRLPPAVAVAAGRVARGGFLVLFGSALVHGVVGPAAPAENLATVVLWPLVLKGVGLVAAVAGSPWRLVSPWETLYDLLVAVEGDRVAVLGEYPDRLGSWPAVVGFLAGVGVLENLTVVTRSPSLTAGVGAVYAALTLAGGVAFGREWFARADALAVLFRLLGRVAPIRVERTSDRGARMQVRPPWTGCLVPVADVSVVVFVVGAVYTVSFDGFTATATFQGLRFAARAAAGPGVAGVGLYLAGLALFVASYWVAAALAVRLGRDGTEDWSRHGPTGAAGGPDGRPGQPAAPTGDREGAAVAFAGTVVPIAAAYEVAHTYPYVAANLSRALAVGRELAGGAETTVALLGWLPVAGFWASQVLLVVGGHVAGVVAAHRVATAHATTPADARRMHAPLVVLMVLYTVLSLWIVSRPLAA